MSRYITSTALAATLVLSSTSFAIAQVSTTDLTAARLPASPPTPVSMGVGSDFSGMIGRDPEGGTPIRMEIDSDVLGELTIAFRGITQCQASYSSNYDVAVIYVDSTSGGISSTATLDDVSDPFRTGVSAGSLDASGAGTANVSTLTFPTGFRPDFAIAYLNPCDDSPSATLYRLQAGTMPFTSLTGTGSGGPDFVIDDLNVSDLGITPGATFRYVATVLNIRNGYRATEFQGLPSAPSTIGTAPFTVPTFSQFTTVGPIVINELDSAQVGTDAVEFIELLGPPGVLLTGTTLVFYNGGATGDAAYAGVDLDGLSLDASGFLVAGNSGVVPAPAVTWANNTLQNGADAVGFHLEDTVRRTGSPASAVRLIDAVVYDTDDADDAALLATLLLPSQPQINENGRSSRGGGTDVDSINRCPPATGARVTNGWIPNPPSPGAVNDCSICGDGTVEGPEECEPRRVIGIGGGMVVRDCCSALCRFQPSDTSCRPSADDCDAEELCTGSSGTCPPDGFLSGSTVCRPAADVCDLPETCTGSSPVCPLDGLAGSSRECRAAAGPCDTPEVCDGLRVQCPVDAMAPATTICRVATGACDAAEVCDGSSASCPSDGVLPAGMECRAAAGDCDLAEVCDGAATSCPADAFADMTTVCRAAVGACDVEEVCGGAATCPMDVAAADGTSCTDGVTCNGAESCSAGTCATGSALSCDDRDLCTADSCAEPGGCMNTPVAGCCNVDADCDDADLCTADTCSGPGGTCSVSPITNCCVADADCEDGNACTADACDATTNRCTRTPVAGCCVADTDCDDGNACTADACDTSSGTCSNTDVAGCCVSNGDCNDTNTCTLDACDAASMTCTNDAIAGCCVADADCDDGDECTTDSCDTGTATCSSDRIPDCGRDGGAGFDDGGLGGDAGATDAGFDAGPRDGAVGAGGDGAVGDAGTDDTEGGCACRAIPTSSGRNPLGLLVLLGAVVLWRRRR